MMLLLQQIGKRSRFDVKVEADKYRTVLEENLQLETTKDLRLLVVSMGKNGVE